MTKGEDGTVVEAQPPRAPGLGLRVLRWTLVVPAAFAGWWIGVSVGAVLAGLSSHSTSMAAVGTHFGVALAAALAILLPTVTAPLMRGTIAWTAFSFVVAVAGQAAWMDAAWSELAVVLTSALAVLLLALRRWRGDGRARSR